MEVIKIAIPLAPVTKKNHQRIVRARGHYMVIPSKEYKDYEAACGKLLPPFAEPISEPVEVECRFYMPTRRRCDLTNLLESIDDILVRYGVLEDDNSGIIVSHDGSRVLYDKENPRTEVTIRSLNDSQDN